MTEEEIANALARVEQCIAEERPHDAVADLQAILSVNPNHPLALCGVGRITIQFGDNAAALQALDAAIGQNPGLLEARNARAVALQNLGRLDEAEAEARTIVEQLPGNPGALLNLGGILAAKADYDGAEESFRSVLSISAGDPTAAYNLGLLNLLKGNLAEGWRGFESRDKASNIRLAAVRSEKPRWTGVPAAEATLLIHAEQGLGDNIQFLRFIPEAAKSVGQLILETPSPLVDLFAGTPGVDQFISRTDPLPDHDFHIPIMSLPFVLGGEAENLWQGVYLRAEDDRVTRWRARIERARGDFHVGLLWAGNPAHKRDRDRSVHLSQLEPLLMVDHAAFHALQIGSPVEQIRETAFAGEMYPLFRKELPFKEVAAAVAALDLVITVDTSLAHLAGAMETEVWTIISKVPDWRWLLDRTDSPWYPSMRLFRQLKAGEWDAVVADMADALRDRINVSADPC